MGDNWLSSHHGVNLTTMWSNNPYSWNVRVTCFLSLNNAMQKINEHHPSIKYIFTQSLSSVDFLDLTIFKGDNFSIEGTLSTKTFLKNK